MIMRMKITMIAEEKCIESCIVHYIPSEKTCTYSTCPDRTTETLTVVIPIMTIIPEVGGMVDNRSMVIRILVVTDVSGHDDRTKMAGSIALAITGMTITDTLDKERSPN